MKVNYISIYFMNHLSNLIGVFEFFVIQQN